MRVLPLVLFPTAALAHPGDHSGADLTHALTQPDHLGMLAMVAAVAVALGLGLWMRGR